MHTICTPGPVKFANLLTWIMPQELAAFANPETYEYCEEHRGTYFIRLPSNANLMRLLEPHLNRPVGRPPKSGIQVKIVDLTVFYPPWPRLRHNLRLNRQAIMVTTQRISNPYSHGYQRPHRHTPGGICSETYTRPTQHTAAPGAMCPAVLPSGGVWGVFGRKG